MSASLVALLALLQAAQPSAPAPPAQVSRPSGGVSGPAWSRDGRLVVAADGDLWVQTAGTPARWIRVTSGAAWDREPAWTADGAALVFSSDRAGGFDLWRVAVGESGAAAEPERLTSADDAEGEPSVGADGSVVFVRGRGTRAQIWVRAPGGAERKLTRDSSAAERWPAVSPDGKRVAFVVLRATGSRLVTRALEGGRDSTVLADRRAEHPSWAPAGDRLAFTTAGGASGVWVAPLDGRYVNLVSARRAKPAWSPDGRRLALAELPDDDQGYNGDPDRLGDRTIGDAFGSARGLRLVDAPAAPDAGLSTTPAPAADPGDRAARNAEAFDRVWERTARLYYAGADAAARRAQWEALRAKHRPQAIAAATDSALESAVHRMLRERPPLRAPATGRAAVSSAHPVATEAGLEVLRKGGNVVDAAVAVSFALGVVEPDASGIGGYGQMLVHRAGMERPALIEFMARVPEDASLSDAAALMQEGRYPDDGPVLAIVPGTVAAMHLAWKKYGGGKLPWADLLAPAIRAAKDGYVVSDGLATTLSVEREHFLKYAASRALFFPGGRALQAGDTLRNPDLAWTLEQIARGGADALYKGEVGRRMVSDLRGHGSAMRMTDLARYYAAEREPVSSRYRGATFYSSAPPVSGGATLAAQLNLLENFARPRPYPDDAATLHAMVAAWALVPPSRGRIADPGLWPTTTEPFTSKDTAKARWRCFDPEKALSPAVFRGDSLACGGKTAAGGDRGSDADGAAADGARSDGAEPDGHASGEGHAHASGTTSFAVADGEGNVVSVTQTLGTWGGNFYVTPGLGFLYNDKLTSYGPDPAGYGARLPTARHGSTLAPTIAFRGAGADRRPWFAVGAAGNAWITSAVYQTFVGLADFGLDPQRALELPRFLLSQRGAAASAGRREYTILLEDAVAPEVIAKLAAMGYRVQTISLKGELRMGYGAAVLVDQGKATAGADPRRAGAAGAVP